MCDYAEQQADKPSPLRGDAYTAKQEVGLGGYISHRSSLRDRANKQLRHIQQEAGRAERLLELCLLLDKNPDVARILDLMKEVG